VIGTFGQVPEGSMTLLETAEDAERVAVTDPDNLSFLTQTTLSVDDTAEIVAILTRRFPTIRAPKGEDICYATTNRQAAVKVIAPLSDACWSSGAQQQNSLRLWKWPNASDAGTIDPARQRHRLGLAWAAGNAWPHRGRVGARKCWSAK
jgi:4-hydroxy-3-methylbut-2-enyl diphosphate reductase IspH